LSRTAWLVKLSLESRIIRCLRHLDFWGPTPDGIYAAVITLLNKDFATQEKRSALS
jgi:hypothetical protein